MSTVHRHTEQEDRAVVFTKGAPDVLLARCTFEAVHDDRRPLTDGPPRRDPAHQRSAGRRGAADARRRRAMAAGRTRREEPDDQLEQDLVFAGLIGMIDPPRPEARDAVARAKRAGIRPMMITGDHPRTAAVIAQRARHHREMAGR